ncbi:MAG: leucine-rich repeat domain-containing protein [Oscillospiraceae bacterium]|jgi:DNA-directed RNA polymerase subunit RPC12/RpoP|nr:leucine-rich repeat domain-containing protein [Oscillospiraceae bacterium]
MKLIEIKCLHCGGSVTIDTFNNQAVCDYCGKSFMLEQPDGQMLPPPPIPAAPVPTPVPSPPSEPVAAPLPVIAAPPPPTFVIKDAVLVKYNGKGGEVEIPEEVQAIGKAAFASCKGLKRVITHRGLRSIGASAFLWCSALNSVTLCEGLESIGESVFSHTAIRTVHIPASVKELNQFAFNMCSSLEHIEAAGILTTPIITTGSYRKRCEEKWLSQGKKCAYCGGNIKTIGFNVGFVCKSCKRPIIV